MPVRNQKLPIRRIVSCLNDDEAEGGGFWLPNIQRPFVSNEAQIERLFDSIMREYPISTLLVWKTRELVKHRKFIDNFHHDLKLTHFYVPDNTRSKMMVLDGQQRLQSLFIGLRGSYLGLERELYFDVLSGVTAAPEDIRYRFTFKDKASAVWPWVCFKKILRDNKLPGEIAEGIAELAPAPLSADDTHSLRRNIERARQEFVTSDDVTYQELDGIENPDAYQVDDIVEIFIRANSGSTKLGKSDLLFSLLVSNWDAADGEMEALLEDLNQGGFEFDRDFVLKSCLTVLGKGARYEVAKFKNKETMARIIEEWPQLSAAIKTVRDLLVSRTYIRSDKAMPSYLALIPLIYYCHRYPAKFTANKDLVGYLLRVLVTGVYGASPDNLIDKLVRNINDQGDFVLSEVYGVIRADGRSMEITPDVIVDHYYGSRSIHLLFNLCYQDFDYSPALDANGPQVDHIFPQSLLKTVKDNNPETDKENILRYRAEQRDQIANCMLLTAAENGFSGKCDTPPAEWFKRSRFKSDEDHAKYLRLHLIPSDPSLWTLDRYDDFVEARKALIKDRFSYMLLSVGGEKA